MNDPLLYIASDASSACDRTILGRHVFHRHTKYIEEDRGKRKKILDEFRCECGKSPSNETYVREHWKSGKRHEEETYSL